MRRVYSSQDVKAECGGNIGVDLKVSINKNLKSQKPKSDAKRLVVR
jgi:hypothetical protein